MITCSQAVWSFLAVDQSLKLSCARRCPVLSERAPTHPKILEDDLLICENWAVSDIFTLSLQPTPLIYSHYLCSPLLLFTLKSTEQKNQNSTKDTWEKAQPELPALTGFCIPQDRTHGFYGSAIPTGIVVFTSDTVFLYDFLIQLWLISQNRINTCSKATKLFFLWKLVFQDPEVLEYPLLFLPCDIDWEPGPHNCVSTQPGKISKFTGKSNTCCQVTNTLLPILRGNYI